MAKDDEQDEAPREGVFGPLVTIDEGERLLAAMEDTADEGGRAGDLSYMSFSGKRGLYSIGVDKREPGTQEPFLVAVTSFELGYMCWKDGKPVSKRMAKITQPKIAEPDPDEFGPFKQGDGWSKARGITVKSLENEEQCYFTINSKSGVASLSDLQREVMARMKAGQDCWPIIYFGEEEFEAQGHKNFKPVFDVVQWVSTEQVQALADPDVDPMSLLSDGGKGKQEPEDKPAPRRRRRL